MRNIICILMILSVCEGWSQSPGKEYFKAYWMMPGGIGDNVISKANKGQRGFGLAVTFITIDRFHIIAGYEMGVFEVADRSLAGNIDETRAWQLYLEVLYKIPIADKLEINPKFSIGDFCISQRSPGENYGRQFGPSFSPGFTFDYRPTGNLRLFAGLNYVLAFPETNTNPQYKSFFGTIQMLNITLGVKL